MEINEQSIKDIIKRLGENKRIFNSEAQFQFELGMELQKKHPVYKVLFEVLSKEGKKSERIDIVIADNNGSYIAIELKYNTCKLICENPKLELIEQGGSNNVRYDFLKDVTRIEHLKCKTSDHIKKYNENLTKCIKGYTILLTNEKKYWEKSKQTGDGRKYKYNNFCISDEDEIHGKLSWEITPKERTNKDKKRDANLEIRGTYYPKWEEYCEVEPEENKDKNKSVFKYLLLEIPPHKE